MAIPGLFIQTLFTSTSIYLSSMERMFIPMLIQCSVVPFHWIWSQGLVIHLGLGIRGCALASCISDTTAFILINIYVRCSRDEILK